MFDKRTSGCALHTTKISITNLWMILPVVALVMDGSLQDLNFQFCCVMYNHSIIFSSIKSFSYIIKAFLCPNNSCKREPSKRTNESGSQRDPGNRNKSDLLFLRRWYNVTKDSKQSSDPQPQLTGEGLQV